MSGVVQEADNNTGSSVRDSGCGLTRSEQEILFDEIERLKPLAGNHRINIGRQKNLEVKGNAQNWNLSIFSVNYQTSLSKAWHHRYRR